MNLQPVDVICQHSRDGTIIPMRIRIRDEEGEYQAYSVKKYKDLSHRGTRTMPDGVYVTDNTNVFECEIAVFGRNRVVRLYNSPPDGIWKISI